MEKTKNLMACATLFLLILSKSIAQETPAPTIGITTSAYAAFLNAEAASDPNSLYDSAMEANLGAACIRRQGIPGDWHYQAIEAMEEKENSLVTFLSKNDVERYCAWTGDPTLFVTWKVEVDSALKSNRASFSIFRTQEGLLKMSGGEVEYAWSTFLEEALLITGMMGGGASTRGEGEQSASRITPQEEHRERGSEELITLITPTPTLHVKFAEDAEQARMHHFFTQGLNKKEDHYQAADALLPELEQAWKARAAALQTYRLKEEALEQAREKFEKEDALLKNKNLNKTTAGKTANLFNKISEMTAVSGTVSGAFKSFAVALDIGNRRIGKAPYKKAQSLVEKATKEEQEARLLLDQAEERAFALDDRRKEPEIKAREVQEQATLVEAKKLKPPVQSKQEYDWQQWAQGLCAKLSQAEARAFAKKAQANSRWAAHQAAKAWMQRMIRAEQDLANTEQEQQRELTPVETRYFDLQQKAEEARSTAIAAQERYDQMIDRECDTHEEYDRLREELRDLEVQKPKTPALLQSIESTRNETSSAHTIWRQAEKELQAHKPANRQLVEETEQAALRLEAQALELLQQKEQLEKRYIRQIERIKAQLQADQKTWREVWPEEVLYQKLQQKRGEVAFATAVRCKSKDAWINAEQEAKELEALWGKMQNLEQQKVWRERANNAAVKRVFLGLQELWGSFSDAVQTLVENPNFDPDFKNSQNVFERGEGIAHAIEKEASLVDRTLFSTGGVGASLMSRAVRNVANIAKLTANTSKPLVETTWRDIVKETNLKALKVAEIAPLMWQEEAIWMTQAIQEAGTFAKSIAEPRQRSIDNTLFPLTELKELGEMVAQIKNIYQKEIRYIRARRNFVGRALEPQKKALLEKKKSFYKRECRWKGERGLLDARKKLIPQWKKRALQNKKLSFQDLHERESTLAVPASLEELSEGTPTTSEESSPHEIKVEENEVDLFQDILAQENRLAEERTTLDQEKKVIDQKEEELRERSCKLEEDAKAMDQKAAILAAETTRITEEKARLAQEQLKQEKQTEETSEELAKKIATLQAEEVRIFQEREALAKEAESLEALASAELDQKTWNLLLGRIHRAIEQEKRAVLEAQKMEGTREVIYWLEAQNAAFTAQELWEEMIQSMDQRGRDAKSPLEKNRLAFEKNNAQKEKESWKSKAAEYLAKVDAVKEKIDKQHLEKQTVLQAEEERLLQEREALAKEAESLEALATAGLDQKAWDLLLGRVHRAIEQEKKAVLEAQNVEGTREVIYWLEAHHAAFTAQELWEEMIQNMDQRGRDAKNPLEKNRLALEKNHAQKEKESWKNKAAEYLAKVDAVKEKIDKQHLEKENALHAEGKRLFQEREQLSQQKETVSTPVPSSDPWEIVAEKMEKVAVLEESILNLELHEAEAAWKESHHEAVEIMKLLEELISSFEQRKKAAIKLLEKKRLDSELATARSEYEEWKMKVDFYLQQINRHSQQQESVDDHEKRAEIHDKNVKVEELQQAKTLTQVGALARSAEALTRGDQVGAALQEKVASVQGSAASAYSSAASAQARGDDKAAEAYRKSAQAYEQVAEALARGDQAGAALQEKIAGAQGSAASAYSSAASAQVKGDEKAAGAYRKRAHAYEQVVEALARSAEALTRGDQAGAALQEKVANAQGSAASAYSSAASAQVRGDDKAAEAYRKRAQAYEQVVGALARSAEALTQGDQAGAALQEKIAGAQGSAASAYSSAALAQVKGDDKVVEAYLKQAHAYEQVAVALARGDQAGAALQGKIAGAQGSAAGAYSSAASAQVKGDDKAAKTYRKSAQVYEQVVEALARSAEALTRGDQVGAALQEKIATAQRNAASAYSGAASAQVKGDDKTAEAYHKCAHADEQQAGALARSAEALTRGDQAGAALQEKIAGAQGGAANAYSGAISAQVKGDDKAAKTYRKSAQVYEQVVEALARSAEALTQGDQAGAALQEKIAGAQRSAAGVYSWATSAQVKGDDKVVEAYLKQAHAYEQVAVALARGDQADAALQGRIAGAQGSAASAYSGVASAQIKGNEKAGEAYLKKAHAYEQQAGALARSAEALTRGDQAGAALQGRIAGAQGSAAGAYSSAASAQVRGDEKAAEAYRKSAQIYEQQAGALAQTF